MPGLEQAIGSPDLLKQLSAAFYHRKIASKSPFLDVSAGISNIVGYSREEILEKGWGIWKFIHPDDRKSFSKSTASSADASPDGSSFRRTYRVIHRSGEVRWINDFFIQPQDDSEVPVEGILFDITEHKTIEQQLRIATNEAMAANHTKSEFLASMSHEIRTPLNGIIGMAGLLREGSPDDHQRQYAELLSQSSEALLSLVDDILDFSKIEAGRLTLEEEDYDPAAILETAVQILASRARGKGIDLASHVPSNLPALVKGDPKRVRQILLNLIGNGIKFTEKGSVTATVTRKTLSRRPYLRFSIVDQGRGISKADQKKLFQRFFQVDGSDQRNYAGTGLGLAICKELIQLMDGRISVKSRQKHGSTFTVDLPLKASTTGLDVSAQKPDIAYRQALVVEDDDGCARMLYLNLTTFGVACRCIKSAQLAQASEDLGGLDLPLIDLVLVSDRLEGLAFDEAARLLGGIQACRNATFGLITDALAASWNKIRSFGFFAFALRRPISRSSVFDVLQANYPAVAPEPANELLVPLGNSRAGNYFSDLKVLVVEDHRINQILIQKLLANEGIAVTIADTGATALGALAEESFNAVLMDVQMPEMDGFEATRRIRELGGKTAKVPVIALTANAMKGDRERCLASGMDDYLSKPIKVDSLLSMIRKWCEPSASSPMPLQKHGTAACSGSLGDFLSILDQMESNR